MRELRTKILTKEEELKRTEADLHATSRERGQTEVGRPPERGQTEVG